MASAFVLLAPDSDRYDLRVKSNSSVSYVSSVTRSFHLDFRKEEGGLSSRQGGPLLSSLSMEKSPNCI